MDLYTTRADSSYKIPEKMREHYKDALASQNACNASGLIHSLSKAVSDVWEEVRANHGGSEDVARHPIVRLYLEQITSLGGLSIDHTSGLGYFSAVAICEERAEVGLPVEA